LSVCLSVVCTENLKHNVLIEKLSQMGRLI